MKTKLIAIVCAAAVASIGQTAAYAKTESDPAAVAADALVARPLCLVATIVGSAIFVVSLPVAATSKSIDSTAEALVLKPYRATFARPLGDFDYSSDTSANAAPAAKKKQKHLRKTRT